MMAGWGFSTFIFSLSFISLQMDSVRVRLKFDPSVLSQQQRSDGMQTSCILVEPSQTLHISDVCKHIIYYFNLHTSCPNGIVLSVDGYVIPPYQYARILKAKDIISVKRKEIVAETTEDANAEEVNPVDNAVLLLED